MVVSVTRIELYLADFVEVQTLAYFGGIMAGNFFQLFGCRGRSPIHTDEDNPKLPPEAA